ncbi:MAG TPA: hypothetical protein VD766_07330 [Solirubrobacterales bacterium]|nr:hypothetical protein [Solirubrobacterales bacterium]
MAAFALALAVSGLATAVATTERAGGSSAEAARVNPPEPWRSYPLNQVRANLAAQAEQDACDFEARQTGTRRALLIFLVGRASRQNGKFGVGPDDNFRPHNRIYTALESAADAYASCRDTPSKQVDIAYGVTNYELSQEIATQAGARDWALAQGRVIEKLAENAPDGVGAAMAGDIEPGWDQLGSGLALSLMHGAAESARDVYNFGTVGLCRPFGSGCQGNWSFVDIGRAAQDSGIIALPQIYYGKQAKTWARTANRWDLAGNNCPRANKRDCFKFGGVTSHIQGCAGVHYTPRESWLRMRRATRRPVGRRLIYFNPRGVGCSRSEGEMAAPDAAASAEPGGLLPLMPKEVPAEIVEDPEPVVSSDVMPTLENAWRVGSHTEYTWVFAGSAGLDSQTGEPAPDGRIIVTRETYRRDRPTTPTMQTIDVPGSGPLRISAAPLGRRVTEDAHHSATVQFEGASGVTGTLDLGTSSVELDAP